MTGNYRCYTREFIVDGCDGIKDPVGMLGTRLEVSACIVVGLLTAIANIAAVCKSGLICRIHDFKTPSCSGNVFDG